MFADHWPSAECARTGEILQKRARTAVNSLTPTICGAVRSVGQGLGLPSPALQELLEKPFTNFYILMLKRPSEFNQHENAAPGRSSPAHGNAGARNPPGLGFEHVHGPHHVLAADGALAHPLAALGAGDHVAALQQHAVDHGVHADPAQAVVVLVQLHPLPLCKPTEREVTALGPAEPGELQPRQTPSPHMNFFNPQLQINLYSSKNKQRSKN